MRIVKRETDNCIVNVQILKYLTVVRMLEELQFLRRVLWLRVVASVIFVYHS